MANITKKSESQLLEAKNNLGRYPYKGTLTEIAKSRGVSRAAIWDAIHKRNNTAFLAMVYELGQSRMQRDLANAKKLAS